LPRAWEAFWFKPEATSTLALVRIAFGLLTLVWGLTLVPDAGEFVSTDGVLPEQPDEDASSVRWAWGVLDLWSGDAAVAALLIVLMLASISLTVGYRTRLASIAVFIALVSIQRRNPFVFNSGDGLLRVTALYLALAPAGAALSVDRWRRDRDRWWECPARAPWPLRLMQVQLSIVYLSTLWAKLRGDAWNDGTAVSYALRLDDLVRFDLLGRLVDSELFANLITYGTLTIEFALGVLVWNRRLRPWVLACGIALHIGIDLTLRVGFFSYAIFVLYIAFIPPETVSTWLLQARSRMAACSGLRSVRVRRRGLVRPGPTAAD
jgi:hypothetical protein